MIPLIRLGFKDLLKESRRLSKNIAARQARNPENAAFRRAAEIRALPAPKTRNEALSRAAELNRLDQSAATRRGGAEKAAIQEQRTARREATREHLKRNPRLLPKAEDVKDLTDSTLKSLRGKSKRVKATYGDTHATRALDSWLENRNPNATPRQKTTELRRLLEIEGYEGITVKGANKQISRGLEAFGDQYKDWDHEHRGAAWQGFEDYARSLSADYRSDKILADFKAAVVEGTLSVSFYTKKVSDGMGGKRDELRATVRPNLSAAVAEAVKQQHEAEELQKIKDKTDPDTVALLW